MPTPRKNESRQDFVSRCIPIVLDEGTAESPDQAVAICNSIWREGKSFMENEEGKGHDYVEMNMFGGATSWGEYETFAGSAKLANAAAEASYVFENLIRNVLNDEEMTMEQKSSAIVALANGFPRQVREFATRKEEQQSEENGFMKKVMRAFGLSRKPEKEQVFGSAFVVHKDKDGNYRWFGWATNKWRDRDVHANPHKGGEILTDAAHKDYVAWVDELPEKRMPELLAWHEPSTAHESKADWLDYADGFVMASGPLTAKEAEAIASVSDEYDLGMSHGFIVLEKDEDEGLITKYRTFELSFLPLEVAANPWTDFVTIEKEVFRMGMNEDKRGFLARLMGDEFVEEIERENSAKAAELEAAGVDFKESEEPEVEVVEAEEEEAEAEPVAVKDEEEDLTIEEIVAEAEVVDLTEDEDDQIKVLRQELADAMSFIGEKMATMQEQIDGVARDQEEDEEMLNEVIEKTPVVSLKELIAMSFRKGTDKDEARVDGRKSLAKDGPEETEPQKSGAGSLGIPLLDAIKESNIKSVIGER